MTINIQKAGHHRAIVTVDGRDYHATFDSASRRWRVMTDAGERFTTSPKLHSLSQIFAPTVNVAGRTRAPRSSAQPRAPRPPRQPRQPRAARVGRRGGPAFATPKPDPRDLMLVFLAAGEDAMVAKLQAPGAITDAARHAFERYRKLKALALGPCSSAAAQTEAYAALRMSLIEAVKLVF